MVPSRRDWLFASLLALASLILYISFLSKTYVFEGLIRALPIETGRWGYLFPGNYLLYGPLGLIFHGLLNLIGLHQPAVVSLQMMDAIIGSAGIFLFYFLARELDMDRGWAATGSALLAVSLGYWLWSTDAENYILSCVLLMLNFYALVKYARGTMTDPLVLGVLHGLAVLGHFVNTLFGIVIIWVLYRQHGPALRRPLLRYAASALLIAGSAYAAVLIFIQKPSSVSQALAWFAGSAGTEGGGIKIGGGFSLEKLREWLKMSAHIFGSFQPAFHHPFPWIFAGAFLKAARVLLAMLTLAFAWQARALYKRWPVIVTACALWLAVYAMMFTRWEPWTMVYRVPDLVPLWILLLLTLRHLSDKTRWTRLAALALVICLAVGNLGAEIFPRSRATNNPHLQRMSFVRRHTEPQAWVTGDSRVDEIYLPYFAQRRPILIGRFQEEPAALTAFIDQRLAAAQPVYVSSRILGQRHWDRFFAQYQLTVHAADGQGFVLYRVNRRR